MIPASLQLKPCCIQFHTLRPILKCKANAILSWIRFLRLLRTSKLRFVRMRC